MQPRSSPPLVSVTNAPAFRPAAPVSATAAPRAPLTDAYKASRAMRSSVARSSSEVVMSHALSLIPRGSGARGFSRAISVSERRSKVADDSRLVARHVARIGILEDCGIAGAEMAGRAHDGD